MLSLIAGLIVGATIAYPIGVSRGKAEYESKKELLRQRLLEKLPTIPVPEWVPLPEVLNWLKTCPSEDALKWAIQALNLVIDKWETQSQFITALMESLKEAFHVPPTLGLGLPRITRKTLERVIAKELPPPPPAPTTATPPVII